MTIFAGNNQASYQVQGPLVTCRAGECAALALYGAGHARQQGTCGAGGKLSQVAQGWVPHYTFLN